MTTKISHDEYKVEWCSITDEECKSDYCHMCEIAKQHAIESQQSDDEYERLQYTTFEKSGKIDTVDGIMINSGNIAAKITQYQVDELIKINVLKNNPLPYEQESLKNWYEVLSNIIKYNGLGVPDEIIGQSDRLAAFRFGAMWYLIAPRIEDL